MEIQIRNERELTEWEVRIGALLQRHELDYVLGGVRQSLDKLKPFDAAGIALFAIRYSLPPIARPPKMRIMPWSELAPLANLVTQYLITDPVTFNPPAEGHYHGSTLIPLVLRLAGNQFPFDVPFFGQYARALKLFHYIPEQLRGDGGRELFDIDSAFQKITGIPVISFIDVGYSAFAAAVNNAGFTGGWFQKAKTLGMNLDEDVVIKALDQLAADQWQLRAVYDAYKQPDRRYGMHDFNPLFVYPIVRPWTKKKNANIDEDRMIAPLPGLILTRLSEGIYQQLFHSYRDDFAQYFGRIFEIYVGEVLDHSLCGAKRISEREIKHTYKNGKVPDHILVDSNTATLVECKATGYQRKALATADPTSLDQSVSRVIEGLIQLHEFKAACDRRAPGLEDLHGCSEFKFLIVTFEPFYIVNSVPFQEVIRKALMCELSSRKIEIAPWYVLAVDQLEKMQPHLAGGVKLPIIIDDLLGHRSFDTVLKESAEKTGRSYRESFLSEMDKEIWQRLNIPIPYEKP